MRRDLLLLDEIAAASRRATDIATRHTVEELARSLDARDALLWNRIVHGYWSVDLDVIHAVALQDLPGFAAKVAGIAEQLSREE